jgi:glycosyltransferase involved in cell wall biosynthesis
VADITWWKQGIARLYDQLLGRLVFRCADQIISINQANVAFISRFISPKKIAVIYNGIAFPVVAHQKEKKTLPEMVYVGRLAPGKGVHILLAALQKLKEKGQSAFHLSLIGDGDQREVLETFVKEHRLENVTFL